MTKAKKRVLVTVAAFAAAVLLGVLAWNLWSRKTSELTVTQIDLDNDCIYAEAKNQLYDTEDRYIIQGASDYLKGRLQLSQIETGETILVISNGKVLLSDPYQFDTIYKIQRSTP